MSRLTGLLENQNKHSSNYLIITVNQLHLNTNTFSSQALRSDSYIFSIRSKIPPQIYCRSINGPENMFY